jgi:hypothetical protein
MQQQFSKIWYATEKQIKNRARFFNFSDRGSIHASSGKLQFKGRKYTLSIKDIKTIDVTYPHFPSISIILSLIFSFIFLGFFVWIMDVHVSSPLLLIIPFMTILASFFFIFPLLIIQKLMLWVEVTYLDDNNVLQHAYFFDGAFLGWRGVLGGSMEMYKKLKQCVMSTPG